MGRPSIIVVKEEHYRQLAKTYYQTIQALGLNPNSACAKYRYSKEFLSWLETMNIVKISEVEPCHIHQYHQYLKERPNRNKAGGLNEKTISGHLQVVDEVFDMLLAMDKVNKNPCSSLAFGYVKESSERMVLSKEEILLLYSFATELEDRAILSLGYGCGLRTGEMSCCNIEDVKLGERILIVPRGKGNKRRVIPMSKGVLKNLEHYYYRQRIKAETTEKEAFLLNSKGRRMQHESFNRRLRKMVDRTKNVQLQQKQPTIHCLRHSIATHLIEEGMDLEKVKDFLGHSRLETTEIYTHIAQKALLKLMGE